MSPTDATAVINIQDYLADLTVAQRRRVKILLWHAAALVKRGFCTLAHARDANGDEVPLRSPLAVQWDAPGAILRAGYDQQLVPSDIFSADDAAVVVAADNLLLLTVGEGTIRWSDRHTGKEVAATMCALADRVERVAALPQETRGGRHMTAPTDRRPAHVVMPAGAKAWWYENPRSIDLYISPAPGQTILHVRLLRRALATWLERTAND